MIRARSADPGAVTTSTDLAPSHRWRVTPACCTRGCAMGQSPTSTSSWERCLRSPARPSGRTAKRTLVRQRRPPSSPGSGSTVTSRSIPAMRRSCWRITAALRRRCASRLACCQSQPPQPSGRACGQPGSTRSAEATRTRTASARANRAVVSVILASTRSPGSACLTKTTRPLLSAVSPGSRATHQPPCATSPTTRSRRSCALPTTGFTQFSLPGGAGLPASRAGRGAGPGAHTSRMRSEGPRIPARPPPLVCWPAVSPCTQGEYRGRAPH